ncbi:hypothetical protein RJ640_013822 [Escallonia rubra]|uniref:F-box domain-containing protein n=1 Tax=Escallonia rubra TaxID=112253 RepID=A0AA88Q858_9ASTE|nr:hypothetical protein RJ640_013822 [Escallonia rubra]
MSDLPEEVLFDIFARLPVKTVLQIRCVCKLWLSLISIPVFITAHINRTTQPQSETLFIRHFAEKERHQNEHYSLHDFHQTFGGHGLKLEFPFKTRSRYHFSIVGSYNGVLCLSDHNGASANGVILWNPSIRKYVSLPRPRVTRSTHGSYMFVLGFGFDVKSNDYKVVRVAYVKGRNGRDLIPPEVEVYGLSSKCWRSFAAGAPPYGIYEHTWSQAFVNGAVHWIGYDPCVANGDCSLIVSFDVGDEVFKGVRLPDCLVKCGYDLAVSKYEELLSVMQMVYRSKRARCCVWVMKEYGVEDSWTKLYTVDLQDGLHKVLGFWKNKEVLTVTVRGKLVSYDPNSGRMRSMGLRGAIDSFYADNYIESLVLVDGESIVLGADAITCGGGEEDGETLHLTGFKNRSAVGSVEECICFGGKLEQEVYSEFSAGNYGWG